MNRTYISVRLLGKRAAYLALVLICAGLVAGAPRVAAVDGRDFAGTYSLADVTQGSDTTTLTFSMRVFNYSDGDIANATVTLEDSGQPGQTYATFTGVGIALNDSAQLSSQATVATAEVERWNQGTPPKVTIQFTDGNGESRVEGVELAPAPPGQ